MKIRFLGTGVLGSDKAQCASYVLGDHIMLDVGFGAVTGLRKHGLDTRDIDTLVLSHFHPDHIGDLAYFLLRRKRRHESDRPLTIIAPPGVRKVINMLGRAFRYGGSYSTKRTLERFYGVDTVDFRVLGDGDSVQVGDVKISAFRVKHTRKVALGYVIETADGLTVGYTGDTAPADYVWAQIPRAKHWIVEASRPRRDEIGRLDHTSLESVAEVAGQYPEKSFYATHRREDDPDMPVPQNIRLMRDDEVVDI